MEEAREHGIPVLATGRSTSSFMAELIYCLGEQLAPCITVHGVLVDVYGEGVMTVSYTHLDVYKRQFLYRSHL